MKRYEKNEEYDLWLACLGGESSVKTVQIAKEAGGSEALFSLPRDGLLKLKGVGERSADYIIEGRKSWDAEKKRAELAQKGIRFIPWYDRDYPKRLLQTEGYPFALFVKGELPPEERSSVAIIGARECSEYGREAASFFAKALASADVSVISGMAIGIDGISQMEALRAGGRSFGVLGCGVDVCYPASNRNLYRMLEEHGGLISEYAPGVSAITWHFPARNRIISGLCDLLLVVEAKEQSGTFITVDAALEQGREICVVPGRIFDPMSAGCNRLWKQGAVPVTDPEELLELLNNGLFPVLLSEGTGRDTAKAESELSLESDEKLVYSCLDLYARSAEEIMKDAHLSYPDFLRILTALECKGYVRRVSPGYYIRVSRSGS